MKQTNTRRRRPPIIIGDLDHERLTRLASAAPDSMAATADELLGELDRARTRPQSAIPAAVVQMGSFVTFRAGSGQARTVQLVYPAEADIAQGRVSVLTPIGAALIGLAEGQSIGWEDRSGNSHELTVDEVRRPQAVPVEAAMAVEARA
jgi:regulator of nucleoside diphosphate kinase